MHSCRLQRMDFFVPFLLFPASVVVEYRNWILVPAYWKLKTSKSAPSRDEFWMMKTNFSFFVKKFINCREFQVFNPSSQWFLLQTDDLLIRWHLIMSGWFVVTGCESRECWCLVPIWFLHQCHNPVKITIVKTSFAPNTLCVTPCFHPLIIIITNHTNTHWSTLHSLHKHF